MAGMKFTAHKKADIDNAFKLGLFAAKEQILTDCNYYVKVDQGTLRSSAYTEENGDTLDVIWDTPYAKRQYYTGTPSKDQNPNASLMWAEEAAKAHKAQWLSQIQKGLRANL